MGITQQIGASSLIQPGVCTSTTRPASPYTGQCIYETDTNKMLVWNGTAWYPNWNTAWGVVARVQRATSTTGIGTTETVDLTTPSFTAVTGRLYKLTYFFPGYYSQGANTEMYVRIRTTNTSGTLLASCTMRAETALTSSGSLVGYTTLTGGSYTLVGAVAAYTNTLAITGATNFNAFLLVEDIGPA